MESNTEPFQPFYVEVDGERTLIVAKEILDGGRPHETTVLTTEDGRTVRPLGGGQAEEVTIMDRVEQLAEDAVEVVTDGIDQAQSNLAPVVEKFKDDAAEVIDEAKDIASDALEQVTEAVTDKVQDLIPGGDGDAEASAENTEAGAADES